MKQVIYFQSMGASTTTLDSSTITKQTLLSVYAGNTQDALTAFSKIERSVQAHASATTLPIKGGAGPATVSSAPASSSGAAAAVGQSGKILNRTGVISVCLMAFGGLTGVLAILL